MKNKKRIIALFLAIIAIFSLTTSSYATNSDDILYDHNMNTRGPTIPTMSWNWNSGVYTGNFNITQFTNTNYYFYGNSSGYIYYYISGTSNHNNDCRVEVVCVDTGTIINSFTFKPSITPFYKGVNLGSHSSHGVYLRIIAYDGGAYWSNNDFAGTIKVSNTYANLTRSVNEIM